MSTCLSRPADIPHTLLLPPRGKLRIDRAIFAIILAQLVAFWPVWFDYVRRMRAGIDEPWGLLALLTAIVLLFTNRSESISVRPSLPLPSACVLLFALSQYLRLPPLIGAILAVTTLALTLSPVAFNRRLHFGLLGLLLLSLPLSSALQFYLGYPMRCATATLAAPLLHLSGFAVSPAGTVLHFGNRDIWVDAPCSGVKMLWTGAYLSLALAAFNRLGNLRTVALSALALLAVLLGNVLRSAALFHIEAGVIRAPAWAHTAIGLVAFTLIAIAVAWAAVKLAPRNNARDTSATPRDRRISTPTIAIHLLACGAVAVLALIKPAPAAPASSTAAAFRGWPSTFDGLPITEIPLAPREQNFLTDFPGRVAKFTDGHRQLILRWTNVPTRKLHLSADCFRGAGFSITPQPALAGKAGVRYSRMIATRGNESLRVSERIYDDAGHEWPDASSWYWSAAFAPNSGPWWAVTIVESAPPAN